MTTIISTTGISPNLRIPGFEPWKWWAVQSQRCHHFCRAVPRWEPQVTSLVFQYLVILYCTYPNNDCHEVPTWTHNYFGTSFLGLHNRNGFNSSAVCWHFAAFHSWFAAMAKSSKWRFPPTFLNRPCEWFNDLMISLPALCGWMCSKGTRHRCAPPMVISHTIITFGWCAENCHWAYTATIGDDCHNYWFTATGFTTSAMVSLLWCR